MKKKVDSIDLKNIRVAAPCEVGFENMEGDDRVRFCKSCSMNVYNIGALSSSEAVKLIQENEERLCIRLYQRKDGTVLTDNCPIGLRRVRDRLAKVAIFALLLSGLGWISGQQAHSQGLVGAPIDGPRWSSLPREMVGRAADNSGNLMMCILLVLKSAVWMAGKNAWPKQTWFFMSYFAPFAFGTLIQFCYLGITDDIVISIPDGLSRSFTTGMSFGIVCLFFAFLRLSQESLPLLRR